MANASGNAADQEAQKLLKTLHGAAGAFRSSRDLASQPAAKSILGAEPAVQAAVVLRALRDVGALRAKISGNDPPDFFNLHHVPGYSYAGVHVVGPLLARDLPLADDELAAILREIARFDHIAALPMPFLAPLLGFIEKRRGGSVTAAARGDAQKIATALLTMEGAEENRLSKRFAALAKRNGSTATAGKAAKGSPAQKPAAKSASTKKSAAKTTATKKTAAAKTKSGAKTAARAR